MLSNMWHCHCSFLDLQKTMNSRGITRVLIKGVVFIGSYNIFMLCLISFFF